MKGKGGIPDRWLPYKAVGAQIKGTPFLACKVPLKESLCQNLPSQEDRFTPLCLVKRVPNLGMVIDLTNTFRYYDKTDFVNNNVEHVKILCEGHVIPSVPVIAKFFTAIDAFVQTPANKDKLIAVHCTHGLNRTGYLVCRYMIQKLSFQPDNAIQAFGDARGHFIERQNYLNDLMQANWPMISIVDLPKEPPLPESRSFPTTTAPSGNSSSTETRANPRSERRKRQRQARVQRLKDEKRQRADREENYHRSDAPDSTRNHNPHRYYPSDAGVGSGSRYSEGQSEYWFEDSGYQEFHHTSPVPPPEYYGQPRWRPQGQGFYTRPVNGVIRNRPSAGYEPYPGARNRTSNTDPRNRYNGYSA